MIWLRRSWIEKNYERDFMATIKDLVDIGKQLAKLEAAVNRIDAVHQDRSYQEYELCQRVNNLEEANRSLRELVFHPHTHWWK